ncbi:class I SAM-dependent methyltransferase [Micromonospora sp. C28SCA-DRY-2]|uniref:class I SAM-dependent methyltransferase n=1 Tax=Micromonospora sp. C28SCA-DRY-2 TaxID=3059522 RepID=UPI002676B400|nr:class I SAM-dependent methyltransferase [Micromonospora sp. C28SCA-DRY-2]MDO3705254.1 class I SAM-dependent methyltransferase [Micromonospora sp. C28SCA-DRY-2]
MSETTETRHSYDRVADRYATEIGDELTGKPLDRALLAALAEFGAGGPVLDVGCGPGQAAAELAGRGARPVGLDLSPAMCALATRATGLPCCVADMTALPVRSAAVAAIVCLYAVIHLDAPGRAAAYAEFARVLRPGGSALIAFHTRDAETPSGQARTHTDWWGHPVALTFRFLDPAAEVAALARAGLTLTARLDRQPDPDREHASERCYLLVRRPAG